MKYFAILECYNNNVDSTSVLNYRTVANFVEFYYDNDTSWKTNGIRTIIRTNIYFKLKFVLRYLLRLFCADIMHIRNVFVQRDTRRAVDKVTYECMKNKRNGRE